MKNEKKMNDKGFSLVELIIVIAIMAVLVGVLAPQFMKYVEQSRRATDIQNAAMIRDSILADIADGTLSGSAEVSGSLVDYKTSPGSGEVCATAITTAPTIQGNLVNHGGRFTVTYHPVNGTCTVTVGTYDLTDATQASSYKTATTP